MGEAHRARKGVGGGGELLADDLYELDQISDLANQPQSTRRSTKTGSHDVASRAAPADFPLLWKG
jgi:hypothetical protein